MMVVGGEGQQDSHLVEAFEGILRRALGGEARRHAGAATEPLA
jgi:hypothetical protein